MATQPLTITAPDTHMGVGHSLLAVSNPMVLSDNTAILPVLGFRYASVIVTGTFGAGGNVAIVGSHAGAPFGALTNPLTGVGLNITAPGIYLIAFPARFIRATVNAGDGTTLIVASFFLRGRLR